MLKVIENIAMKEIELCKTSEELRACDKRWNQYNAQLNKFLAGKRAEPPYFDDDGKVV